MNLEDIERLRTSEGHAVEMLCSNGELLIARILHVDDEYQDVIYDLISSSVEYPKGKTSAYVKLLADIVEFRKI